MSEMVIKHSLLNKIRDRFRKAIPSPAPWSNSRTNDYQHDGQRHQ